MNEKLVLARAKAMKVQRMKGMDLAQELRYHAHNMRKVAQRAQNGRTTVNLDRYGRAFSNLLNGWQNKYLSAALNPKQSVTRQLSIMIRYLRAGNLEVGALLVQARHLDKIADMIGR